MYLILLLADAQKSFEIYKNKLLYIYADICCTKGWKVDERSSVNSDGACWTLVVFRVSNKFIKLYIPPLFFYIPPPVYTLQPLLELYIHNLPLFVLYWRVNSFDFSIFIYWASTAPPLLLLCDSFFWPSSNNSPSIEISVRNVREILVTRKICTSYVNFKANVKSHKKKVNVNAKN